jgi:DNA-binding NarL/FixJ family response regulator
MLCCAMTMLSCAAEYAIRWQRRQTSCHRRGGWLLELREVLRAPCDVLLLDLNMPGRSGLEVLIAYAKPTRHQGAGGFDVSRPYALRCLRAGAQGYANKASDRRAHCSRAHRDGGAQIPHPEVAQMLAESSHNQRPKCLMQLERELQTLVTLPRDASFDIAEELMPVPRPSSIPLPRSESSSHQQC